MESITHQTFEQLQALTGCDDHLQFVVKVIEKVHISESVRVGYEQQIQRIQRRRTDPNFYLAVIGEFSSGKSTFINALLRDDLLKTSALIATSAATKLRYGDNINVEVIFQGSSVCFNCNRCTHVQSGSNGVKGEGNMSIDRDLLKQLEAQPAPYQSGVEGLVHSIHRTPDLREWVTLESTVLPPVPINRGSYWGLMSLLATGTLP